MKMKLKMKVKMKKMIFQNRRNLLEFENIIFL